MDNLNIQQSLQPNRFTKQNLWSNVGIDFLNFQKQITNLLIPQNNHAQQLSPEKRNSKAQEVVNQIKLLTQNLQIEIKRKFSKVLFQSSVDFEDFILTKRQNSNLNQNILQKQKQIQTKTQEMQKKLTDLQRLVKIYEKALINKKLKINDQFSENLTLQNTQNGQKQQTKRHKMIKIHVLDMKIQFSPEELQNINGKNLSSSRLSSSFLSKSRHQPQVLRDMEREWNKSVNLSSKSIKSGHKLSIRKDDTNFMKSSMKKSMRGSFIKQQTSHACKISNKQNKLCESAVSQFSISKY